MQKIKNLLSKDSDDTTGDTARAGNYDDSSRMADANSGATGAAGGMQTRSGGKNGLVDGLEQDVGRGRAHEASAPDNSSHQRTVQQHAKIPGQGATHDHAHVQPVTKQTEHAHTVEEVTREREHDRHVHHVQHHVQPIKDVQHESKVHHEKVHPTTEVREQHTNTAEDQARFSGLQQHHNETIRGTHDRQVVDKGERVIENVSHHTHHVVQPVIERDVHQHHVHHTTIPTHQVTHEAPIIHQSTVHEPMAVKDFLAGGGDLSSKVSHEKAGVLATGDCERDVRGPAETLTQKLGLGGGSHAGAASSAGGQSIGQTSGQSVGRTGGQSIGQPSGQSIGQSSGHNGADIGGVGPGGRGLGGGREDGIAGRGV